MQRASPLWHARPRSEPGVWVPEKHIPPSPSELKSCSGHARSHSEPLLAVIGVTAQKAALRVRYKIAVYLILSTPNMLLCPCARCCGSTRSVWGWMVVYAGKYQSPPSLKPRGGRGERCNLNLLRTQLSLAPGCVGAGPAGPEAAPDGRWYDCGPVRGGMWGERVLLVR